MKEVEEGTDSLCLWIGKINIVKLSILCKVVYEFNAILIIILIFL